MIDDFISLIKPTDFDYLKPYLNNPIPGFPNDGVRWKVAILSRLVGGLGDTLTQDELVRLEKARGSLWQTVSDPGRPLPPTRTSNQSVPRSYGPSRTSPEGRERDDSYGGVLFYVSPSLRVIVCKQGIQWIIQRRVESRWIAKGYPTFREGVRSLVRKLASPEESVRIASRIDQLPHSARVQTSLFGTKGEHPNHWG
jgi:hypothetical protein